MPITKLMKINYQNLQVNSMSKKILCSSVFIALFLSLLPGQDIVDGIAAIVGDNIILRSEVQQLARMNASQMRIDPRRNPAKFEKLLNNSLKALIEEKILLEQAKIDSIEVKDREVETMLEQQIQGIIQQAGSQQKAEEILGSPLYSIRKEYRPIVRNRLIVERLRTEKFQNISISRREVEDFHNTYRDSIPEIPPVLDFSQILVKIEPGEKEQNIAKTTADSLLALIRSGADFAELAKEFSEDPGSASAGGDLGYINRGGFIKEFEEVAFALDKGEISDVVKTMFGYHIIQQLDKKGEKINVRHILISPKVSDKNIADAYQKAKDIRSEIITNTISFDSAAVRYSDDVDSRANAGRIERIPKNQIQNADFLTVLDTLEVDEISTAFRTDMGFHIIQLHGIYDDSWYMLEQWALEFKRNQQYQKWLENLRSDFYIDIK